MCYTENRSEVRRPTMKSQELFLKFKIRIFGITKLEFENS